MCSSFCGDRRKSCPKNLVSDSEMTGPERNLSKRVAQSVTSLNQQQEAALISAGGYGAKPFPMLPHRCGITRLP